uniref:Uncharacterized protein n=1 Tax=Pseudomonas phage Touem01 TaxID=3138548 RepID=A0AAU6W1U1_9VIRU
MNDEKLFPAPCLMHTANVFLPGSLGPVRREVMLAEDVQDLVDRLAHATSERDLLATAIANAGVAAGVAHVNMAFDVPRLVKLAEVVGNPDPDGERFRHMVDTDVPGSMRQVGVCSRDNEAYWLAGDEARRAVDAEMKPPEPAPEPDVEAGPPDPFTDRICHNADCWYCKGSGWWRGRPCDGDEIPF